MAFDGVMGCDNFEKYIVNRAYSKTNANIGRSEINLNAKTGLANISSDFSIEGIIGTGGFGAVFLGHYGGTKVAIKSLHKCTKNKMASLQSFRAEINAIGLHHDNLVKILATTSIEDFESGAFIIMEYVGNRNLLQAINNPSTSMPILKCVRYGIDVCRALQYLHTEGIVHLDVKPANIMITNNDRCKLGDFGCSQRIYSGSPRRRKSNRTRNRPAATGTVAYRAPELLRGDAPTTMADIYSIGITLWQMLSRETPYSGQDHHVVVFGVVAYNQRPHFSAQLPSTSRWYQSLCTDCWGCNPENRPSAEHLITLLQRRLDGYGDADNA